MLPVGDGELWMMSTPNGQKGFFYETWNSTECNDDWLRISVKATECPRIPEAFLAKERSGMLTETFSQEYMCEFHGNGTEYFDLNLIMEAVDESIPELEI